MIGRFPIGRRPVGKFRLIVASGAIVGSATVAFALASSAAGGPTTVASAAAGFGLSAASAGALSIAGTAAAGFVVSAVATGTVTSAIDLFTVPLPGSRVIDGPGAVPGVAALPVQIVTIKPVGGLS